jgi:hypothetical protein
LSVGCRHLRAGRASFRATDHEWELLDIGVQLHGGYGYITEYPIARAFLDAVCTASTAAPTRSCVTSSAVRSSAAGAGGEVGVSARHYPWSR